MTPNGFASRQTGPLLAFSFQVSIFRPWSKKPSSSNFRPVEASFCWGFVLFFRFGRAWPFAGLGFQRLGSFYLTFRRKATGKQSARRVCFGHASVGQGTKLTTFTQAFFNKCLTALLPLSTEAQGKRAACSSATAQHEPQRSMQPSGRTCERFIIQ